MKSKSKGFQQIVNESKDLTGIEILSNGKTIAKFEKSNEDQKEPESIVKMFTGTDRKLIEIKKVKYNRDESEVEIQYTLIDSAKQKDDIKIVLKSKDKPLDSLVEQLDLLSPFVEKICSLPEGYCSSAEVRGVSFSWAMNIMGAVITCLVSVPTANSPVCINTPHLPSSQYSESGTSPLLPSECVGILETLIDECEKYINGERQKSNQTEMDLKE